MRLFLEDKREASRFSVFYDYMYGKDNVAFCHGCGNAIVKSKRYNKECTIVLDIGYDNQTLLDNLYNILDYSSKDYNSLIHVVPVMCSEYLELLTMEELGYLTSQLLRDIIHFREPYRELVNYSCGSIKNFEKCCKTMLKIIKDDKDLMYRYAESKLDDVASRFLLNQKYYEYTNNPLVMSISRDATTYESVSDHFKLLEVAAECNSYCLDKTYLSLKEELLLLAEKVSIREKNC